MKFFGKSRKVISHSQGLHNFIATNFCPKDDLMVASLKFKSLKKVEFFMRYGKVECFAPENDFFFHVDILFCFVHGKCGFRTD